MTDDKDVSSDGQGSKNGGDSDENSGGGRGIRHKSVNTTTRGAHTRGVYVGKAQVRSAAK